MDIHATIGALERLVQHYQCWTDRMSKGHYRRKLERKVQACQAALAILRVEWGPHPEDKI